MPPTLQLLGVAVSQTQFRVQPCGFWLLLAQMISFMATDAHNLLEVKISNDKGATASVSVH